jgi:hypothetical protein
MAVSITKIQFLAHRDTGHPIFYCHANDMDHNPLLAVDADAQSVVIRADNLLFKVKKNPQTKNRIDIYMSISSANELGRELIGATQGVRAREWRTSNATPHQFASGRMALPDIVWSKFDKAVEVAAEVNSGTRMVKQDAYVNIDLEKPHATHIMMSNAEIHIGISLDNPTGVHDENLTFPVNVAESELQRGTGETNPIYKVLGHFMLRLTPQAAAGLGLLLMAVSEPA